MNNNEICKMNKMKFAKWNLQNDIVLAVIEVLCSQNLSCSWSGSKFAI